MPTTLTNLRPVNSLTYSDVAGLSMGLTRFPGENASVFLQRCFAATTRKRDHSYEGTVDELCLQLGLGQWLGISFVSSDANAVVSANVGLVTVTANGVTTQVPTVTMAPDNYWQWQNLSDVVEGLNAIPGTTAVLLGPDGPALQLARQSNILTQVGEPLMSFDQVLENKNIIESTVAFSSAPGNYTLYPDTGELVLDIAPASGLTVSYQYYAIPFNFVCSDIGLFGLTEPSLATVGVGTNNTLAFQLQEAIQAVMATDLSYWAE